MSSSAIGPEANDDDADARKQNPEQNSEQDAVEAVPAGSSETPDPDRAPEREGQDGVMRLDSDGVHLVMYRLTERGGEIQLLDVSVLWLPGAGTDDDPTDEDGPGGGDSPPLPPSPNSGLDAAHDEPAPSGGLLSIYDIFDIA